MSDDNEQAVRVQRVTFQPKRHTAGQKPKYTPQRVRKICDYVALGLPYSHACAAVGISGQTLGNWKKRYPEFAELLKTAEAEFMNFHLEVIEKAQDPQASMKLLKARFPEHFSDGEKAVNVRMQVEGRVTHEASESLEETLHRYAAAIETVSGGEIIDGDIACLPPGDFAEDDSGEPVYPPATDSETG